MASCHAFFEGFSRRAGRSRGYGEGIEAQGIEPEYIIVQAGGKGSRLGGLTKNKPKAIVPVNNTPMIFRLFSQFPGKRFIVVGDYLFDVLERYLYAFAKAKYMLVRAAGEGTCAGLGQALGLIPDGAPLMIVWSDLLLPDDIAARLGRGGAAGITAGTGDAGIAAEERAAGAPSRAVAADTADATGKAAGAADWAGAADKAAGTGDAGIAAEERADDAPNMAGKAGEKNPAGAAGATCAPGEPCNAGAAGHGGHGAALPARPIAPGLSSPSALPALSALPAPSSLPELPGLSGPSDLPAPPDLIGISKDFPCRWSYAGGKFLEAPSSDRGVAGLFAFRDKSRIAGVPDSGEFVRWLGQAGAEFAEVGLSGAREVGTAEAHAREAGRGYRCRPFNELSFAGGRVAKTPIGEQGEALARRERAWYREAAARGFARIPRIYSYDPLEMEEVGGQNAFRGSRSDEEKKALIGQIVGALSELHGLGAAPADAFSLQEAYYTKTMRRLDSVAGLIPYAGERSVAVNGRECRNPLRCRGELRDKVMAELVEGAPPFALIHGDCTFSNIMAGGPRGVVLLDPRGYFGFTELRGDPRYDWAKLYYSIRGDYDQFNNGNFRLDVGGGRAELEIGTSGFRGLESYYLGAIAGLAGRGGQAGQAEHARLAKHGGGAGGCAGASGGGSGDSAGASAGAIRLIHALIWLSLAAYAWEDYDSVCGAFYNGLYYLEECW
ncbi:MAG: NTP transferase domain-containing protein [Clostridiales bacterium]|nr:NTP transferase domain-containing protein [Clostridiales bacterium]